MDCFLESFQQRFSGVEKAVAPPPECPSGILHWGTALQPRAKFLPSGCGEALMTLMGVLGKRHHLSNTTC